MANGFVFLCGLRNFAPWREMLLLFPAQALRIEPPGAHGATSYARRARCPAAPPASGTGTINQPKIIAYVWVVVKRNLRAVAGQFPPGFSKSRFRPVLKTCGFAARCAERLRLSVVEAPHKAPPRPDASGRGGAKKARHGGKAQPFRTAGGEALNNGKNGF
jgi:hypothetical protein